MVVAPLAVAFVVAFAVAFAVALAVALAVAAGRAVALRGRRDGSSSSGIGSSSSSSGKPPYPKNQIPKGLPTMVDFNRFYYVICQVYPS